MTAARWATLGLVLLGLVGCGGGHSAAYQTGYHDGQSGNAATFARNGTAAMPNGYHLVCDQMATAESVEGSDVQDWVRGCIDALTARYGSKG